MNDWLLNIDKVNLNLILTFLLKSRMNNIMNNAFKHKNGVAQYNNIKVSRDKSYFTNGHLNGNNKYTANDICKVTEILADNIYVRFGGQLFRQMIGIPMGTNCDAIKKGCSTQSIIKQTVPHYLLARLSVPTFFR